MKTSETKSEQMEVRENERSKVSTNLKINVRGKEKEKQAKENEERAIEKERERNRRILNGKRAKEKNSRKKSTAKMNTVCSKAVELSLEKLEIRFCFSFVQIVIRCVVKIPKCDMQMIEFYWCFVEFCLCHMFHRQFVVCVRTVSCFPSH